MEDGIHRKIAFRLDNQNTSSPRLNSVLEVFRKVSEIIGSLTCVCDSRERCTDHVDEDFEKHLGFMGFQLRMYTEIVTSVGQMPFVYSHLWSPGIS